MKELEDYAKEKNYHKYLDDLSDIDAENTPGKDLNKSAHVG